MTGYVQIWELTIYSAFLVKHGLSATHRDDIICSVQVEQNLHDETAEEWTQGSEVDTQVNVGVEQPGATVHTECNIQGTGASQLPISRVPTCNNNHFGVTLEVSTCSRWDVPQFS